MKKIVVFLSFMLVAGSFLLMTPQAKAISQTVVDKEFTPGFNYYGRDNSVFLSACTRFTPSRSNYATYFDLAVKNDQGAGYPIKASIRTATSPEVPNTSVIKSYTQNTFNNYAMQQGMSRFVSNDGEMVVLTAGNYYFICVDDLANNNATGWFYTDPVSGGYTRMGYPGDVQTPFNGSFGYRTYALDSGTPSGDATGDQTGGTNQGTTGTTTGNSSVAKGSAPSNNISSAIAKPTGLTAAYSADSKAVVVTWKASTTTTIGGYNVYRSATSGKDYKKIGDTGKTTTTLSDANITASTTYYYMVRAYKDTAESANSNEASALVPANAEVKAKSAGPVTVAETPKNIYEMSLLTWGLTAAAVLLLGILILLILRRRRLAKKIAAPIAPAKS